MKNRTEKKNVKIWLIASAILVVCSISLQTLSLHAKEEKPVKKSHTIQVNGAALKDASAYEWKNNLLIPLRQTAEEIGFEVNWEQKTNSVRIDDGKVKYRIFIGKNRLYELDGSLKQKEKKEKLSEVPIKIAGAVYVPYQLYHILYGTEEVVQLKGNIVEIQTEPDITMGMPNPMKKMDTIEEAEKAAGFRIPIPEIQGKQGIPERIFVIDNDVIQLVFVSGDQEINYRKGAYMEDVSGDYTVYKQIRKEKAENVEVTLKGENDKFKLAVWKQGEYAFAVRFENPVSMDETMKFVISVIK